MELLPFYYDLFIIDGIFRPLDFNHFYSQKGVGTVADPKFNITLPLALALRSQFNTLKFQIHSDHSLNHHELDTQKLILKENVFFYSLFTLNPVISLNTM